MELNKFELFIISQALLNRMNICTDKMSNSIDHDYWAREHNEASTLYTKVWQEYIKRSKE